MPAIIRTMGLRISSVTLQASAMFVISPRRSAKVSALRPATNINTLTEMKTYKIAAIPGDGIGKEVIAAGLEVLNACAASDGGFSLELQAFDWSTDYYKKHGVLMPENGREQLLNFDVIYFGAVGAPERARSHYAVGAAARDLSALRPIRQRAPDPDFPRH